MITETVDINKLATIMQRNCTLKKSDIVAVIAELIETMADVLQDSKRPSVPLPDGHCQEWQHACLRA